jgi:polysaccharide pyruvyl transferase CsaB
MSRVVVSGYYGFENLGDEAVLAATVAGIRQKRPEAGIVVLSADPDGTARALGVDAVARARFGHVAGVLRGCDVFLSGGGSLFQDATSWRSPWYYLGVLGLARRLARRTAVYAQGIGPLRGRAVRLVARRLLNAVDLIIVRDPDSLVALGALGVDRSPAALAGDPALLLPPDRSPRVLAEQASWGREGVLAGLALRPWRDNAWGDVAPAAARAVAERHGVRWICLPMHWSQDFALAERAAAQIGFGARAVRERVTPQEMVGLIGGLHLMVGMRLHALIFGATQGVPLIALAYDPKIGAFVRELGEPLLGPAHLTAESLTEAIEGALAGLHDRRARLLAAVAPLRARAALAPALAASLMP